MSQSTLRSSPELPSFDHQPAAYDGPPAAQVFQERGRFLNPAIFHYYREPLLIVEGKMQYLYDDTGTRYLDMFSGISTVSCGHCHPLVTERVRHQLERLQHASSIYMHPQRTELAAKLARKLPGELEVTYFTNSGSEANDLAIHLARLYTGNLDVIALRSGYHGGSFGTMGLTAVHTWKYPSVHGTYVHHAIHPDPYRSPFQGSAEEIAQASIHDIEQVILSSTPGAVAAFLAEPFQGVGGVTHGAPNYLAGAYEVVRKYGGLCIADEVQTGFCRTGKYWGFEHFGVIPDIVTTAKAFGNGFPLAAVTTRREIAEKLAQKLHFNTFGGNPVSTAAGSAVMDVIEQDGLLQNSRSQGERLKKGLQRLQQRHSIIGDVRGKGLMLGMELVKDPNSKEPAPRETVELLEKGRKRQLLFGRGGLYGNVVRIKPPLCISSEDVDYVLSALDDCLAGL